MKKIVALALCLVLALSLCATAFATTSVYTLKDAATLTPKATVTNVVYTAKTAYVHEDTAINYGTLALAKATLVDNVADGLNNTETFVVVDSAADADYVLYAGTAVQYYLSKALYGVNNGAYKVANKVTDIGSKCGQWKIANGDTNTYYSVYDADADVTNYYYKLAGGNEILIVDNKTVRAQTVPQSKIVEHNWLVATRDADNSIATVKCSKCGAEWNWVSTKAQIPTGVESESFMAGYIYGATTSNATSAVSSAKTFDAGIAMYVGMSIMAVTGSAVVIGKKKEF